MKTAENDKAFLKRIKTELDAELAQLDARTLARLRTARRQAVHGAAPAHTPFHGRRLALAALGTAALAAGVIGLWPETQPPAVMTSSLEDNEILQARDNLDLYQNLEFYRWLAGAERRG